MKITLELDSVDSVLLIRYLNLAIREGEKHLDLIKQDPAFYIDFPVIVSNAKFDAEEPKRLKAIIEEQRTAFEAKRGW